MLEIVENKPATPKSARKRIIFSRSPKGDSSDSSLGPMSPLSESSEQYSSPPSSPNWVFETPRKSSLRIRSTLFGPISYEPQAPKSRLSDAFEILTQTTSDENQACAVNETTIINTEIVAETPSKDSDDKGFATPFKCLASKSLQQTPKRKCLETSNTESNALTPVKIHPKVKGQEYNSESKASSPLPPMTFYGSRARTSLFPKKCLSAERIVVSEHSGPKRKYIFHSEQKLGGSHISRQSISKRLKLGEINVGVRHGVRKNKLKPHKAKAEAMKQPKITPMQRIESYLSSVLSSVEQHTAPEIDPNKRFFKTKRPLQIHEKVSTNKTNPKKQIPNNSSRVEKNISFDEKSPTEIVQHKVQNDVEVLLRQLEDSPEKETADTQNQHISAITSHTSSLALNDSGPWRPELLCSKDLKQQNVENVAPLDSHVKMEANVRKYFPVFNKNHGNRNGFTDSLSNTRSPRGTKRPLKCLGEDQYIIDAGQKKFGATQCNDCGLFYHYDDPEDEIAHQKFHKDCNLLKHSAWKQERVVRYYGTERVILVKAGDPKAWLNKVADVVHIVDQELGYATSGVGNLETCQVYMYVTDKYVIGCLVVHSLTEAYKMLSTLNEECDICSEESYPVKCGISRIWVAEKFRRRRIATKLIDSMRSSFVMGHVLGMQEFAFSAPTAAGKAFAVQYTMTENFLVYT